MAIYNAQLSSGYSFSRTAILTRNSQQMTGYSYLFHVLQIPQLANQLTSYGLMQSTILRVLGVQKFNWGSANLSILKLVCNYSAKYENFSHVLIKIRYLNQSIKQSFFHQYLSSYERFFGKNFRQDATKIYIDKASLPRLVSKVNNTAESLLAALILQVFEQESNYLISKIAIVFEGKYLININSRVIERVMFQIYLHYPYIDTLDPSSVKSLNPNDY